MRRGDRLACRCPGELLFSGAKGIGRAGLAGKVLTFRCNACGASLNSYDTVARFLGAAIATLLLGGALYIHSRTTADTDVVWVKVLMLGGSATWGVGTLAWREYCAFRYRSARSAFASRAGGE